VGNRHVVQHLHLLWVRTLRKFRADLQLWKQYAAFCEETRSFKRLAQCHQDALRYHPHHVPFWIAAASSEFFSNGSASNARVLLQRALRLHPASEELWLQSLVLELHFVQKLRGRRAVLRQEDGAVVEQDTDPQSQHPYQIAQLVYDHAMQSPADSTALRLQCLDQCRLFPDTEELQEHIIASLAASKNREEAAWMARALYQQQRQQQQKALTAHDEKGDEPPTKRPKTASSTQSGAKIAAAAPDGDPVLDTIRQACRSLRTEEMVLQSVRFLQRYASNSDDDDDDAASEEEDGDRDDDDGDDDGRSKEEDDTSRNRRRRQAAWALLREILQDAMASNDVGGSPALVLLHADFLADADGDTEGAIALLQNFVDQCQAKDKAVPASIWMRLAGLLYHKKGDDDEKNESTAFLLLEKGMKVIPMHHSDHVVLLLQLFGARLMSAGATTTTTSESGRLWDLFQRLLLLAPGFAELPDIQDPAFENVTNVPTACLQYLRYNLETVDNNNSVDRARKVCDAVLFQSTSLDLLTSTDAETMKAFVDESIEAEEERAETKNRKQQQKRLNRLYEVAIRMFRGTSLATDYRQQRDERVRFR